MVLPVIPAVSFGHWVCSIGFAHPGLATVIAAVESAVGNAIISTEQHTILSTDPGTVVLPVISAVSCGHRVCNIGFDHPCLATVIAAVASAGGNAIISTEQHTIISTQ